MCKSIGVLEKVCGMFKRCITNTNNTNTYLRVYMKYIHSFFATLKPDPPCYSDTIVRPPVAPKCVTVKQTEGALWEVICMPELFSTLRPLRSCLHSRITASAAHTCNSCSAPAVSTRPSLCDTGLQPHRALVTLRETPA